MGRTPRCSVFLSLMVLSLCIALGAVHGQIGRSDVSGAGTDATDSGHVVNSGDRIPITHFRDNCTNALPGKRFGGIA